MLVSNMNAQLAMFISGFVAPVSAINEGHI